VACFDVWLTGIEIGDVFLRVRNGILACRWLAVVIRNVRTKDSQSQCLHRASISTRYEMNIDDMKYRDKFIEAQNRTRFFCLWHQCNTSPPILSPAVIEEIVPSLVKIVDD
jgi:hypothetical protein